MEKSVHTSDYVVLRRLLRDTRQAAGMTQSDLAEKLGKTQSIVSKFERGEVRLDLIQFRTVCHALGTTLPAFVGELEKRLQSRTRRRT